MPDLTAFEYAADGSYIICSDGPELLVHGGADEAPLWADRLPHPLVAMRVRGSDLLTLDRAGHLRVYDLQAARTGRTEDQPHTPFGPFGDPAVGLDCARHEALAVVLGGSGLYLLPWREGPRKLSSLTGQCLAMDAVAQQVAVGTAAGELHLVQVESGLLDARVDLQAPVTAVVHHPFGFWLAAAGGALLPISPRGERTEGPTRLPEGWQPESLCVSGDGRLVGFRADPHTAVVLSWTRKQIAGQFTYERPVGQVAFGPGRFFGLGLEGGDGNKFDLSNGGVFRTDTFPHRTHNSWVLGVQIDEDLATGGGAQAVLSKPVPAADPQARPARGRSRWKSWGMGLIALLGLILAAYLVFLRDVANSDARRQRVLREEIRRSIHESVNKHMRERKP